MIWVQHYCPIFISFNMKIQGFFEHYFFFLFIRNARSKNRHWRPCYFWSWVLSLWVHFYQLNFWEEIFISLMLCPSIKSKNDFGHRPNCVGPIQIILDQKQIFTTEFHTLNHFKNICTCPKQLECVQNNFLDRSKIVLNIKRDKTLVFWLFMTKIVA